jgi:pyruvate/2-oxoglutarate dehydrogenase complex dihydrolipoamide acyltransferase (E2) component
MPQVPIIMPQLGESIAEATIVSINVKPGEKVVADQEIMEVETNKAVMGVTTPCAGEVAKIDAQVKETYPIGTVLGSIEASEEDAARFAKQAPPDRRAEWPRKFPAEMTKKQSGNGAHFQIDESAVRTSRDQHTRRSAQWGLPVPAAAKGQDFCRHAFVREWRSCN